ncbi:MAG TPA: DUF2470 domain-containing protein [Blastocatellia bacterium]|nr:DUF2470 domain-containing protein [Blastocatellia bacterium]
MSKQGEEVRSLVARERDGMLATLSKKVAGWPFGSVTPYALAASGEPIILISELAEHTRNLRADARASLLVSDSTAADSQAAARATLLGYCIPVPAAFQSDARNRYLDRFPASESYFGVHDFSLFQLKVREVRFIGGFGEIYWVDGAEMAGSKAAESDSAGELDPLASSVRMICDHMNEDHADAVRLYASKLAGVEADRAEMIHVDSLGFDIVAARGEGHKHIRLDFAAPVQTTDEVRARMVEMVRQARALA